MKIIEMVIVTIDSLIYLSDISLLNKETVFSLHIAFKTKIKTIANVVTLIPQPALRGAPPINISAINNKAVGVLIFPISILLKPAVLVVTD